MSSSPPPPQGPESGDVVVGRDREPEFDPTGIRALLAALPDPGPMPPTLVDRIAASLAAEQQGRARSAVGQPLGSRVVSAPGAPSPLTRLQRPERHVRTRNVRRRAWQRPVLSIAGAAAAVVVVGALGTSLFHSTQNGSGASASAAGGAQLYSASQSASSSASSSQQAAAGSNGAEGSNGAAASTPPDLVVGLSSTAYSASNVALAARRLLPTRGPALRPLASEAPAIGPIGTPIGARACLAALRVPASDSAVVDIATYEGQPAAVIVTSTRTGVSTVYVVKRSCRPGHPSVLRPALGLP